MDRVMFVILTCRKNYETRMKSVLDSWLSEVPPDNFIFLADDDDKNRKMIYDNRIPLGYEFVQMKYYHLFLNIKSIVDLSKFDYFFFVDDDTFVNTRNLQKAIDRFESGPTWMGQTITVKGWDTNGHRMFGNYEDFPPLGFKYPSGGSGFIANKDLVVQISNYLNGNNSVPASMWSDMTFGVWAWNSGGASIIEDNSLFHESKPESLDDDGKTFIRDSLTFHYIDHDMQRALWQIVK